MIEIYLKTPAQRGQRTGQERGYPLKLRMDNDPVLALTQQVERMVPCWYLSNPVGQHRIPLSNGVTGCTGQNTEFLTGQNAK